MNAPEHLPEYVAPPHSIEAEQALIGGLLLDPNAWDRIADQVSEQDFFRDDHRKIFRHLALLNNAGKQADIVTLFESIERANQAEQTGGITYLGEIANAAPSAANIRQHAKIIRERASLRRLIAIADDAASSCRTPGRRKPDEIVAELEQRLSAELDESHDEPVTLQQAMLAAMEYVEARSGASGLRTGIPELDHMTGGLDAGQLVVVGARPSVGKTAFACGIMDHVARCGKAVGMFSLEMGSREIGMRLLAVRSSVPVHAMRSGTRDNGAWDRMGNALPAAEKQRLWIEEKPAVGVAYVRARCRRMKRKHGLDLIVIDYIGLMTGTGDNRSQEVGSISRGLKALAKELQIPIIALAQLSRSVEGRTDRRPLMSDLRDSGEVEQDADIVAFLHRESLYSQDSDWDGFAELIVRKNRNGPIGEVPLAYSGELMTFAPWQESFNPRRASSAKAKQPGKFRGE